MFREMSALNEELMFYHSYLPGILILSAGGLTWLYVR